MKAVVLFSGGIDSTTIIYQLLKETDKEVYPVNINYGQKQHYHELIAMDKVIDDLPTVMRARLKPTKKIDISIARIFRSSLIDDNMQVPEVTFKGDTQEDTTNVPFRGVVFVSLATAYADSIGASEVYMMNHATNEELEATHYDANPEAIWKLSELVNLGTNGKVRLVTPFLKMLKKDIFTWAKMIGVNFAHTWTCYEDGPFPCGKCRACYERAKGLKDAGIEEEELNVNS